MTRQGVLLIVLTLFAFVNGFFVGVASERIRFDAKRLQLLTAFESAVQQQHAILMELENQAACNPNKRGRWAWRGCPQHNTAQQDGGGSR